MPVWRLLQKHLRKQGFSLTNFVQWGLDSKKKHCRNTCLATLSKRGWSLTKFCTMLTSKHVFSVKDPGPEMLRTHVVYKFSCANWNACYVGVTSRHFSTRVHAHLYSYIILLHTYTYTLIHTYILIHLFSNFETFAEFRVLPCLLFNRLFQNFRFCGY